MLVVLDYKALYVHKSIKSIDMSDIERQKVQEWMAQGNITA